MAGVSGYAALSARVRAMYSTLLTPQDWEKLSESPDFASLISQLKSLAYGPFLDVLKEKEITPQKVELQIKGRLAASYSSVIQVSSDQSRPLLKQLYRNFEVNNLKAILRSINTEPSWEKMRDVLFPLGSISVLPAQAMVEAGSVGAAVEMLQGTIYYDTLSFAMKRYSTEQNLFPLEVALDLNYWRQLWTESKKLQGEDRNQALKIVGSMMDINNLMWVIRYRVYHGLSEEELINYSLPFGYRVNDADIRSLAAGADIADVVERVYPGVSNVEALMAEPRSGLPKLELELQRHVMKQCLSAFTGNPFHIGIPLAFLVLSGYEVQDLTVLIEGRSSRLGDEDFKPYMLRSVAA